MLDRQSPRRMKQSVADSDFVQVIPRPQGDSKLQGTKDLIIRRQSWCAGAGNDIPEDRMEVSHPESATRTRVKK